MNARAPAVDLGLADDAGGRLLEFLSMLRRRSRQLLSTFGVLFALVLLLAIFWPATYESTGIVLIEQQEVPEAFVQAAVTSYADQRIKMISQRVMTTSNLLEIIRKYDLYEDRRRRDPREKLLKRMRDDIGLEMISADVVDPTQGRATKATIAFAVSYRSDSAQVAAKVANELTTLYLDENASTRRQLAADTADFLRKEADRVGAEVNELDRRIAEFKTLHSDALPERTQVNLQLLARAEEEARGLDARLTTLVQQGVFLDSQLAQVDPVGAGLTDDGRRVPGTSDRLKMLRAQLASAQSLYQPDHPDVIRLQREVTGLEREVGGASRTADLGRQLEQAKTLLAKARTRYSPDHPDVKRYARLVEYIESSLRGFESVQPPSREPVADNPTYIQLRTQREAVTAERRSLEQARHAVDARIAELGASMTMAPGVEREYSALVRDLQGAQSKYQEVRQKQMAATLAENLETEQKGEKFALIEPPLVPEQPVSPNRPLLLFLGLLLGAGGAFGLGMMRDAVEGRVRGRRDLTLLAGVPPLAVVPWVVPERTQAPAHRDRRRILIASAIGAGTVLLLALVHWLYRPLDVIWAVLLRRVGL